MKKNIAVIIALFLAGCSIRLLTLHDTGATHDPVYTVESAQHFWYVRQVALGIAIPDPAQQRMLEWPDGAPGDEDTYLSWQLIGSVARLFNPPADQNNAPAPARNPPAEFDAGLLQLCRGAVIAAAAAAPVLLFFLLQPVCGTRPALLLALIGEVALPLVERSFGSLLYHEHLVLLLIIGHAVASYRLWLGHARHPLRSALLAAFLLALALHGWKATRFYYLLHLGILTFFLPLAHDLARIMPRVRLALLTTLPVLLAAGLLSPHLRTDGFWHAAPLLYHAALAALLFAGRRFAPLRRTAGAIVITALFAGAAATLLAGWLLPATGSYNHVWGVFFAQLQHGFSKPADPALLPPEARLYWVPPYQHASSLRFANDLGVLSLLGLVAAGVAVRRRLRLGDDAALLALLGALATGSAYFLFFKTATFFVPHLLFLLAAAAPAIGNRRALVCGLVLLATFEAYKTIAREQSLTVRALVALGATEDASAPTGSVLDRNELLARLCEPGEAGAVIAHYGIGAPILAYAGRPLVLQCYFETARVRAKIFAFAAALYGSEQDFTAFARRYDATTFVYSADMALASDGGSYRYLADAPARTGTFADTCQFYPEQLRDWRLVWQNSYYRVFRWRRSGDAAPLRPPPDASPALVFSPAAFARYRAAGLSPADFLRDAIAADRMRRAAELSNASPAALQENLTRRFPLLAGPPDSSATP